MTTTQKAELVLSILKGELTVDEASKAHDVSPLEIQNWINEAVASIGSTLQVYEQLRKIKTRVKMHVFAGGSLACIQLHDGDIPIGTKSDFWCSSLPLPEPAAGEVILNYSRSDCRLAEVDILYGHLCLPAKYRNEYEEYRIVDLDMELDFKAKTATVRLDRADKEETLRGQAYWYTSLDLPPPLMGTVSLGIHNASSRVYHINFRHADRCLPGRFFSPQ